MTAQTPKISTNLTHGRTSSSISVKIPLPTFSPITRSKKFSFSGTLRIIWNERKTRNVFLYLLLNLAFMAVEIIYGYMSNSLGLIGDGVHMLLDSSAIILSLVAAVIAKWEPTQKFSFGFGRVETLAGFVNCSLLVYVSLSILIEAIERFFDHPEIHGDQLFTVALIGFIINLIGIFAFDHGHDHSHDKHSSGCSGGHHHHDSHTNPLFEGMYLHILADTLGSLGVIVSSLLVEYYDMVYADSICSVFIAVLILLSIIPLFKRSAFSLLQATPDSELYNLEYFQNNLGSRISGFVSCPDIHLWENSSNSQALAMKVIVKKITNEQDARNQIQEIITDLLPSVRWSCIQIEKDVIVI